MQSKTTTTMGKPVFRMIRILFQGARRSVFNIQHRKFSKNPTKKENCIELRRKNAINLSWQTMIFWFVAS